MTLKWIRSINQSMPVKILYDAECPLCVKFASAIRRLDHTGQFELLSLQVHFSIDATIPLEELEKNLHVIDVNGTVFVGEDAFDFILQRIPAAKPLRSLVVKTSSSGLIYSGINHIKRWTKSRYSLNKSCKHCRR